MLCTVIVAYFAASSVSMASAKMFWWSYQGENSTESYDPVFEICAGKNATSCAACSSSAFGDKVGAVLCESSEKLSNICYEPKKEETCCKDRHGTSCYKDFYCAYTDDNVAFCCADGEDVKDCGKTFNQTLSEHKNDNQATASRAGAFQPSMTASDQTRVARPDRTTEPNLVPGSTKSYAKDPDVERKGSAAVKIGISIGGFVGVAILLTLSMIALLHWRKQTKYNAIAHGQAVKTKLPAPPGSQAAAHPISGAPGPYEPMRGENSDPQRSWMHSPPQQFSRHVTPDPFADNTGYSDHPAQPQHELKHVPPSGCD